MWYVYSREVKSGKEQFVRMSFETAAARAEKAVKMILNIKEEA